jgi:predicted RNA-binding Zn-ribbon protein involved in translation (DUF1610 family)
MGTCWSCGKELSLQKDDTKCDSCGEEIYYRCNNCKELFLVYDEEIKQKRRECKVCGYFQCPHCGVCSLECERELWQTEITKILAPEITYTTYPSLQKKINRILEYIEDIKLSKEQKSCERDIPITYAKSRIKRAIIRMRGYKTKNKNDMDKFKERYEKVMDVQVGTELTINQSREAGTYGQEYRDIFNFAICRGKLKIIKVKKMVDGEEKEFLVYKRVENGDCKYLDMKDLVVKYCPSCKKIYDSKEWFCSTCQYKKGSKIGQYKPLKVKISNKDTCQLNRGCFKKYGERQS